MVRLSGSLFCMPFGRHRSPVALVVCLLAFFFPIPAVADELSSHPLLVEHDEQGLSELSALLGNEPAGALLDSKVLCQLSGLRGLDPELDRLELALIYGAAGVLGTLSIRVADLRARLSHPSRAAASWS